METSIRDIRVDSSASYGKYSNALVLHRQGKYKEAVDSFTEIAGQLKNDIWFNHDYAVALTGTCKSGNVGRAIELLETAKESKEKKDGKGDSWIESSLAVAYGRAGRYEDALNSYKRSYELNNGNIQAAVVVGSLKDTPKDRLERSWTLDKKGRYEAEQGNQVEALRCFEAALSLASSEKIPWTLFERGKTLSSLGCYSEAIPVLQKVRKLLPDSAWPDLELGKANEAAGKVYESSAAFKLALSKDPNNDEAKKALEASKGEAFYKDRRSDRIKDNPHATLRPEVELPEYFNKQNPEYMKELEEYMSQEGMKESMDENCDAIVCVPVYTLGEGQLMQNTLEQYLMQIDQARNMQAVNPTKFEIILFLNHPAVKDNDNPENPSGRVLLDQKLGHSYTEGAQERVKAGKPERYDTEEVIKQFQEAHPELKIRVMKKEFPERPKWGKIIKPLYDVAMLRSMRRANPTRRDPTIITNDADLARMSPTYLRDILQTMDMNEVANWRNPNVQKIDAIVGTTDMDKDRYKDAPGFLLAQRLDQFINIQNRGNRSTQGRNTAIRASTLTALGGINENTDAGADGEMKDMINQARHDPDLGYALNTIKPLNKAWLETDPRREFDTWKNGTPLIWTWNQWEAMNVYGKNWKDRFKDKVEDTSQIDKKFFEREINEQANTWLQGPADRRLQRALDLIGLRNHQAVLDRVSWQRVGKEWKQIPAYSKKMQERITALGLKPGDYQVKNGRVVIDKKEGHQDYHIEQQPGGTQKIVIDDLSNVQKKLQEWITREAWKTSEKKIMARSQKRPTAMVTNKLAVEYLDYEEFDGVYGEIFISKDYPWEPSHTASAPVVIDLGGHIGMSVMYWKDKAPDAHVTVVEANPQTAEVLQRNIARNSLKDVHVIQGAVSAGGKSVDLYMPKPGVDFRWGDFTNRAPNDPSKYDKVTTPAVRLSELITRPVDLLKVDIEGSETDVLKEAEGRLSDVKEIMMEFHNNPANPANSLAEIRALFARQGFTDVEFKDKGRIIDPDALDTRQEFLLGVIAKRAFNIEQADPKKRAEMIETSSNLSKSLPNAVLCGGVALRLLYEAKTGKPMFGSYKGDYDVRVPNKGFQKILNQPPQGHRIDKDPKLYKPESSYIVLRDEKNKLIDVFGVDEVGQSEKITLGNKQIRVLALGEQIAEKLRLYIEDMGQQTPAVREKHRFYARKLLELVKAGGNEKEISAAWKRMQERKKDNKQYAQQYSHDWKTLLDWLVTIGYKES